MKKTILFGALTLIAVWIVSCSKNGTPPPSSTLINGAGSTFDYPALTKWFEAYSQVDPNVKFNYQSIISGAGQKQWLNQTVGFGASDAPMTDESMSNAPGHIL